MMEKSTETLIKETKTYIENVSSKYQGCTCSFKLPTIPIELVLTGHAFSQHYNTVMSPIRDEYGLESRHPSASQTLSASPKLLDVAEELKTSVTPELELIETRIIGPAREFQGVLKAVRKTITKRQHKV